ncbi:hypothetical protein [Aquimarina sp. 2201CG5-10]|uniref:hypothetical protein n=1 Tax=Aquimarina callyspongiae TaxID=3098150 RepID=UPI002AB51610|nr:hypothetical protein [Aquimarina sp. 2201CG5-10]MDY8136983.1 hypothetical protein [Aquimarina sp. 2201CG5-10]
MLSNLEGFRILKKQEKATILGKGIECPIGWHSTDPCTGEPLFVCVPPWEPTLVCLEP